jgi:hypothetical protein
MERRITVWAAWPLAGLFGAASGAALGWLLLRVYLARSEIWGAAELLSVIMLMPALGLGLGAAQALVLRRFGVRAGWWVLATLLGWLLGLSVDFTLQRIFSPTPWLALWMAGLYQGALQWLVLRRASTRSMLWIPTSLLAWGGVAVLVNLVNPALERAVGRAWEGAAYPILSWGLAGLAFGVLSVPGLRWIFTAHGKETR